MTEEHVTMRKPRYPDQPIAITRRRLPRPNLIQERPLLLTPDEERVLRNGTAALQRLQTTRIRDWNLWVAVGEALLLLREKVMEAVGAERPIGAKYNLLFGEWLSKLALDMPNSTRSHLLQLLEHRQKLEQWRASLPAEVRFKYTHPNSIWRIWKASQQTNPTEPQQ